jgi:hypothetical protein
MTKQKAVVPTKANPNPPVKAKGGYRAGAGRPKGSKDNITVKHLLENIFAQTNGRDYEELLIEDFLHCRDRGDSQAVIKYHNLILSKVMNTLAKIEVTDSADAIATKQQAFADALSKLTGIKTGDPK